MHFESTSEDISLGYLLYEPEDALTSDSSTPMVFLCSVWTDRRDREIGREPAKTRVERKW